MTTDITELVQSLKAAADREMFSRDVGETSEIWERNVTPENILALVEALEKAQTKAIEQGCTACELFEEVTTLRQRIAELESRTVTVKLPNQTQFDDPLSAYEAIEKCKEALTAEGIKWEVE